MGAAEKSAVNSPGCSTAGLAGFADGFGTGVKDGGVAEPILPGIGVAGGGLTGANI